MHFPPTTEFEKWAKEMSGFDGGNPESPIWICGIEPGYDKLGEFRLSPDWTYYWGEKGIQIQIPAWTEKLKTREDKFYGYKNTFLQKACKIVCHYYNNYDQQNNGPVQDWEHFFKSEFLIEGGKGFLINLYPIAFRNLNSKWSREHFERTGFPNKELYRAWCMENRFPLIKSWTTELAKTPPKVIVCVGLSMRLDYLLAFADTNDFLFYDESKINKKKIESAHQPQDIEIYSINEGATALLITPFLGRGGLMKDESLEEVAKIAATNITNDERVAISLIAR